MPVTDKQLAALRARLAGKHEEHKELFAQLDWPVDGEGYTALHDAAFFEAVDAEADEVGRGVRNGCLSMPDPQPLSMFDNIYAEPSALLREEREQYAAYLDSFADQEVAR